ncbi:hypothetical protein ACLK12_06770 [Escherichia coli]
MPRLDAEGDSADHPGQSANLLRLPTGCPFQARCPHAMDSGSGASPLAPFTPVGYVLAFTGWRMP